MSTMSLEPPMYLSSIQNNIRARPIPWEGAVRAGNITDDHLKKIKAVDKVRKDQRRQTVEGDISGYVSLLSGSADAKSVLGSASKRNDIVQYILVLAADLINDVPALSSALIAHPNPYKPFLPLLHHSTNADDPIPLLTSTFLTNLVSISLASSSKSAARDEEALPQLYTYLSSLTQNQDSGLQDIGVQELSALLRTSRSREIFWKQRGETVNPLIDILRAATGGKDTNSSTVAGSSRAIEPGLSGGVGLQLLYRVLLVIWQLSFEGALIGDDLQSDHEFLQLYTYLLRLSPKEKTTRLLLATLNNLLSSNRTTLLPVAVFVRLPALLSNLSGRHLTDPDLLEDLKTLSDMLDEYTKTQTTFDQYAAELQSGHLRWSPPHRNPTFWKDNARRILDDANLPKKLAEIISKEWDNDKQVLAIACNDVGHLVKELPGRRAQLEKLGLKARVMELMADKDESDMPCAAVECQYSPGEFIYTTKASPPPSEPLALARPVDPFSSLSSDQKALLHHFLNDASQITACHTGMQRDICQMLVPMALQTPSLLYATMALSAIHLQALHNQSENVKSAPEIARFMALSLEHFRAELQDPNVKGSDALLATARTLCLAEIHSGAIHPNSWRAHIEGAKALMDACDNRGALSPRSSDGFRRYLDRWYRSIVSLTALTGNGPPIGDVADRSILSPANQHDSPDYLDDYWGFTINLAAVFRGIGAAAWRSHPSQQCGGIAQGDESSAHQEAAVLESSVRRLMDREADSQPAFYPGVVEGLSSEYIRQFILCNEAFQHSALIQIHRRLRKTPASSPEVQASVKRILECTAQIGPSAGLSPWTMLTTPLFIAGCEAGDEDREKVRQLLSCLHDTIRVPNVLQSLRFLEQYWSSQIDENEGWNQFLDRMKFDFIPY
ncbi:armadillo-type protein [Aspergillus pseudotamarii]|uniref:Armadillo-type protein n=1 Tax=Aspergillus pseudotamarii TaxID=132259 RepID=A0A5N6SH23_ASPPS|nr:armadillo-type protein [Aspergillus pseudotamarii]KAE8133179.1 armadillo-type protein [Aspergillus pseudotamarii]